MVEPHPISITQQDRERLQHLIQAQRGSWRDQQNLDQLEQELDRAHVVDRHSIAANVVTMNSRVRVRDLVTGKETVYQVVFPSDADSTKNMISVLAPIGTALLGYKVGSNLEWETPGGVRRLRVEAVEYQPEAAVVAA